MIFAKEEDLAQRRNGIQREQSTENTETQIDFFSV